MKTKSKTNTVLHIKPFGFKKRKSLKSNCEQTLSNPKVSIEKDLHIDCYFFQLSLTKGSLHTYIYMHINIIS